MIGAVILWTVVTLLFVVGLVGTVVPILPGAAFIFLGIALYALVSGFEIVTVTHIAIFGLLALSSVAADYLGGVIGAKLGGGSRLAVVGALVGALLGLIFSPLGMLIGVFAGAVAGALMEGREPNMALKTALYAVAGALGAMLLKFVIGVVMIVAFFILLFG